MPSPRWSTPLSSVTLAALALLLVGCAGDLMKPGESSALDKDLREFASDMHWGDFDAAGEYVDPKTKLEHPLTALEIARFKQIEVSDYDVVSRVDGTDMVDQKVQLQIINRNTQVPRTIVYHEHWRWDATAKRWWLTTGLPDITPQD
jgi:hypothetical protein